MPRTLDKSGVAKRIKPTSESIFSKYAASTRSLISLVAEANKGVTPQALTDIAAISGYSKSKVADLLSISEKTLIRYKSQKKKLSPVNSELALKLISLFKKGEEVFGELGAFKEWLEKPAYGLGNQVPYNLLHTSNGIDLVIEELIRIEYGDLA